MKIQILDKAKKKKFISGVSEFGLSKIPQLLIRTGTERIRAYSGNLSTEEIMAIWRLLPIEGVGLYVGKESMNRNGVRETRLSLDGLHIWASQLTSKIIILDEEQEKDWFFGKNMYLSDSQVSLIGDLKGFFIVKSSDGKDFIGTGKLGLEGDKNVLFSFLPKERRRKSMII
ncbi:MAG: hypothetical protein ABIF88_01895 [archaeon]